MNKDSSFQNTFLEKTEKFFHVHKVAWISTVSVLVILILGFTIFHQYNMALSEKANELFDRSFQTYRMQMMIDMQTKQDNFKESTKKYIDDLLLLDKLYPHTLTASRASLSLAQLYISLADKEKDETQIQNAKDILLTLSTKGKTNFYKQMAFLYLGEIANSEKAYEEAYHYFENAYKLGNKSGLESIALLYLANSAAKMDDKQEAHKLYERYVTDYPDSELKNFAKANMLYLEK